MIYLSTNCLGGRSFERSITALRELGVDRLELSAGGKHIPDLHEHLSPGDEAYLVHNYFPPPADPFVLNLSSPSEQIATRSQDLAREAIDLCRELGADVYTIHGGFVADPDLSLTFEPAQIEQTREEAFSRFVERIEPVVEYAESQGVRIGVENNVVAEHHAPGGDNPFFLFHDHRDFEALFDEVSSTELGVLLDTGHLKVSARSLGFDPTETLAALEPRIWAYHVHDNDARTDRHEPVDDEGYYAIPQLRRAQRRDVPIVVETVFDTPQDALANRRFLEQTLEASPQGGEDADPSLGA